MAHDKSATDGQKKEFPLDHGTSVPLEHVEDTAEFEARALSLLDDQRALLRYVREAEYNRRRIEQARREWTQAFDAIDLPLFMHDEECRVTRANRAYARESGCEDIRSLLGRPYYELFPRRSTPLLGCQASREALEPRSEMLHLDDGRIFESRTFPIVDGVGHYGQALHIMDDVTERYRAEETVRTLSSAMEQAAEGMLVADADLAVTYANPTLRRLVGMEAEQILGQPLGALLARGAQSIVDAIPRQAHAEGGWAVEVEIQAADGSLVPVHLTAAAVYDDAGDLSGYVATLLDLRSIKAALQQVATLAEAIEDVSLQLGLDDIVHKVLAAAARVCGTDGAAVAVPYQGGDRLYYRWQIGEPWAGVADGLSEPFPADAGIASQALQSRSTQVVEDYADYPKALPGYVNAGARSAMAVPFNSQDPATQGILTLGTVGRRKRFSDDQVRFAEALARQLGVAIQRQKLVDDLRRSSERLAQVFATVPDILFVMCPKTLGLELVSPMVTELLGFLPEEFTGDPGLWQRQIHADDRQRVLGELREALAEADGFTLDLRVWHKDGHTLRWFEGRAVVERDQAGQPKRLVGALSDITLRRQTQQALEAQRNFVTAVLDTAPSLIVVLERDGRVVNWNRACEALTGLTVEQVRGQPVWDLLPEDLAGEAKTEFSGLVHQGAAFQRERAWLDRQGTPHIVAWSVSVLTGPGGEVTHLIASGQDVSAQRRAEKKVEQLARFAAENPNPVLRTNRAGRLLYANDASEALLEQLGCAVGNPMPPGWCQRIERALRDRSEERFEIELGGRYFLFSFSAANDTDDIYLYGLDVTERHEAALQLRKVNRALTTLSRGNEAMIRAQDEPSLLQAVCANIAEQGGYRLAWVGFCGEEAGNSITPVASAGPSAAYVDGVNMRCTDEGYDSNPIAAAIRSGRPVMSRDMQSETATGPWRARAVEFGFASCIALPLMVQGEVIGVLTIYADEPDAFDRQEQQLLGELASDLAYGVASLRSHAERNRVEGLYRQSLVDTIQAIALTVEKRDPYTAGHQQRVADLSAAIAAELNFDPDRIEGIRLGALIHDIGKIYIPSEILNRPGRLSEPEFELIKTHPAVGYDIVKDVHFPWPVAAMILQHHERLNGSGYPSGLNGDEILPEAKIMAVADVVEAITSHRPYRPGLGLELAKEEIRAHRGTLYSPEAVDACLRVLDRHGFSPQ